MAEQVFPPLSEALEQVGRTPAFLWRKGFDYLINRPEGGARQPAVLLGGALSQSGDDGLDEFGIASYADCGMFIASYLWGFLPIVYDPRQETHLVSSWTGIIGWSADLLSWWVQCRRLSR